MACNELLITSRLTALPGDKWGAATQDLGADPPVVPLLGYFVGGSSEAALAAAGTVEPAQEEALWLVYKWERLLPLAAYPSAKQNTPSFSGLLWLVAQPPDPRALRWGMLRRVTRGMLRALAFCHERGVVHGGVGAGSFLLSTFEDHLASEVVVKLTDFGFARMVTARGAVPSRAGVYMQWLVVGPIWLDTTVCICLLTTCVVGYTLDNCMSKVERTVMLPSQSHLRRWTTTIRSHWGSGKTCSRWQLCWWRRCVQRWQWGARGPTPCRRTLRGVFCTRCFKTAWTSLGEDCGGTLVQHWDGVCFVNNMVQCPSQGVLLGGATAGGGGADARHAGGCWMEPAACHGRGEACSRAA